jgi:hypothetical protein
MDRPGKLLGQRRIDGPLALDSAPAGKGAGHDLDSEMALATRPRAGMAGMTMGIVENFQPGRLEGAFEFGADAVGDGHVRVKLVSGESAVKRRAGLNCNGLSALGPMPILPPCHARGLL